MSIARSAAPARKAFASLARAAAPQRAFSSANANGVTVAASDDGNPTASITVALKAGPRFETTPGVAHVLKNFVFKVNYWPFNFRWKAVALCVGANF